MKLTIKKIQYKLVAVLSATVIIAAVAVGKLGIDITEISTIKAISRTAVETAEVAAVAAQNTISTYTGVIQEIGRDDILTSPQTP